MAQASFLAGKMLIAMPGIGDPRFERALILICSHDETQAMGLAVNQPVRSMTVPDILKQLSVATQCVVPADPVMLGGPVQTERGFVLHSQDLITDETLKVGEALALTTTRQALEALAGDPYRPTRSLLALGYAGWGAGQLEAEIRHNVWLTCDATDDLVFGADHDQKWRLALKQLGVDPGLLTTVAGTA